MAKRLKKQVTDSSRTAAQKLGRIVALEISMDSKHLAVCGHILAGKDQGDAWMAVYPRVRRKESAKSNCSRMLTDAYSGAREYIGLKRWEATAGAAERLGIDKERVLASLLEISERCMQIRPVMDRKGEQARVEDRNGGPALAFTFDARGALRAYELMGKELGMFKQKDEPPGSDPLKDILDRIAASREGTSPLPSGE